MIEVYNKCGFFFSVTSELEEENLLPGGIYLLINCCFKAINLVEKTKQDVRGNVCELNSLESNFVQSLKRMKKGDINFCF